MRAESLLLRPLPCISVLSYMPSFTSLTAKRSGLGGWELGARGRRPVIGIGTTRARTKVPHHIRLTRHSSKIKISKISRWRSQRIRVQEDPLNCSGHWPGTLVLPSVPHSPHSSRASILGYQPPWLQMTDRTHR